MFIPKKGTVKHLTRLTKSQLHSTFDPGCPDIGWWPWPKHQRQASHFSNPWRFIWRKKKRWRCFLPKLWPWLIQFSLLIHVLLSVVTRHKTHTKSPNIPLKLHAFCPHQQVTTPWSTRLLPVWLACVKMIEHHKRIADTKKKHSFKSVVRLATWFWTIATYWCLQFLSTKSMTSNIRSMFAMFYLYPLDHRGSQFSGPTNHSKESFPRVKLHQSMEIMSRSL